MAAGTALRMQIRAAFNSELHDSRLRKVTVESKKKCIRFRKSVPPCKRHMSAVRVAPLQI